MAKGRCLREDIVMCKCTKGGIMMCKLKGWIDKGGHYVEIKKCLQKGHYDVQIKRVDG